MRTFENASTPSRESKAPGAVIARARRKGSDSPPHPDRDRSLRLFAVAKGFLATRTRLLPFGNPDQQDIGEALGTPIPRASGTCITWGHPESRSCSPKYRRPRLLQSAPMERTCGLGLQSHTDPVRGRFFAPTALYAAGAEFGTDGGSRTQLASRKPAIRFNGCQFPQTCNPIRD